jgi:hypothetical protein
LEQAETSLHVRRRFRPRQLLLAAAGVAALGGAVWYGDDWWTRGGFVETTDDAYVGGDVTAIAPHVAGFVETVAVTDNQRVHAGDVLLRLDPRDFTAALDQARASREGKQAAADSLEAQLALQAPLIRQAEAELRSATARDAFARQEAERYATLEPTVGGSRQQAQRTASLRDDADAVVVAAGAKREAALAQLDVLQRQLAGARAAVREAEAVERRATLDFGYTRGFSAYQIGTAIFSTGIATLLGTPVYILLARRFDTRWLMTFGLACFGASMWSFSLITSDWGAAELLVPQILRGFPQVFAVAPSVTLGLGSLPPERLKYASGLFNMMRNLGGAVGIAVSAAIINDRTNLHFLHIASRLTPANGPMNRLVSEVGQRYGAQPGAIGAGHTAALERLWHLAYREASTLAFADAFRAIMLAFAAAALLAPLLRKVAPPAGPAPAAH